MFWINGRPIADLSACHVRVWVKSINFGFVKIDWAENSEKKQSINSGVKSTLIVSFSVSKKSNSSLCEPSIDSLQSLHCLECRSGMFDLQSTSVTMHGHLNCCVLHSEQDSKTLDFHSFSRGVKSTPNRAENMLEGATRISLTIETVVFGLIRVSKYSFRTRKFDTTISNHSYFSKWGKLALEWMISFELTGDTAHWPNEKLNRICLRSSEKKNYSLCYYFIINEWSETKLPKPLLFLAHKNTSRKFII